MPDNEHTLVEVGPMTSERPQNGQHDPTLLTTEQIRHELGALKELVNTRFDGIDQATELRLQMIQGIPLDTAHQLAHLKELFEAELVTLREKFNGVDKQFEERDVRVAQSATTQTTAVNAALQAAKEAVGEQNKSFTLSIDKSEAATMKQIDAQSQMLQTATTGVNGKIDDIKVQLARVESVALGRMGAQTESQQQSNWQTGAAIAGVGVLISLGALAATIVAIMSAN